MRTYEEEEERYRRRECWFHVLLLFGSLVFAIWLMGFIGVIFWFPLMCWYASRGLINQLGKGLGLVRRQKYESKSGSYHAFDDREVRVACDDSGRCRVAADDVLTALGQRLVEADFRKLATRFGATDFFADPLGEWWFSERAIEQWLDARCAAMDQDAMRFRRWLMHETFPPLRRKQALGLLRSPSRTPGHPEAGY